MTDDQLNAGNEYKKMLNERKPKVAQMLKAKMLQVQGTLTVGEYSFTVNPAQYQPLLTEMYKAAVKDVKEIEEKFKNL